MNRVNGLRRQLATYDVDHPEVVRRTVDGLHADVFDPQAFDRCDVCFDPSTCADYETCMHSLSANEPSRCPEPAPRTASHTSGAGSPIQPERYPPRCAHCGGAVMETDSSKNIGDHYWHHDCWLVLSAEEQMRRMERRPPAAKERDVSETKYEQLGAAELATGGYMIDTPPKAEKLRLLAARETFTSRRIAILATSAYLSQQDAKKYADLFAAAPDLYAACVQAREFYDQLALSPLDAAAKYGPDYEPPTEGDMLDVRRELEAALAKANGEA